MVEYKRPHAKSALKKSCYPGIMIFQGILITVLAVMSRLRVTEAEARAINATCSNLTLLHVIPSAQNEELSGWDHSYLRVLHNAAQIALDYINNSPAILPGVTLDIVDVSTDDCARGYSLQDLVETFRQILEKKCVVGVIGLYCSRVTDIISTHLTHENWGYIQLSASTSPLLRSKDRYPYLFGTITSSVTFNDAVLKMMDEFGWNKISIIYDFSDIFFRSTAIDFVTKVRKREDLNLQTFFPIRASGRHEILRDILKNESKITYFSVTHKESSDIICDAYRHGYYWPEHVYIFVDDSLAEILNNTEKCTREQLLKASEGVIFLLYRLNNTNDTGDSRINYQQYKKQNKHVQEEHLHGMDDFANVLYDQIWAFTLAFNNSFKKVINLIKPLFQDYVLDSDELQETIAKELRRTNFQGASGHIKFNEYQEVLTEIDIVQIKNGSEVVIGIYSPYRNTIIFNDTIFDRTNVPKDSYEVRHDSIPVWLSVLACISQCIAAIINIITCIYIIYKRNAPEIKSTCVFINVFVLIGCGMVIISSVFYNLENLSNSSPAYITAFCNLELWFFFIGISMILVGLIFRLTRVFIVFHYPQARIRFLKDKYLFLYIIITCIIPMVYMVIWFAADHVTQVTRVKFIDSDIDTHYTEYFFCSSTHQGIWLSLYMTWLAILLAILLVLAIQTRHIKFSNFKDTKKIGAFVFAVGFLLFSLLPLSEVLHADEPIATYILKSLLTFMIPMACFTMQYIPKLYPVFSQKTESRTASGLNYKNSKL